jgi:hypothetical protein
MTNIIGSKNSRIEIRTSLDGIVMTPEEIAEEEKQPINLPVTEPVVPINSPIVVPSGTDEYWEIPGVTYRGASGNVHVLKGYLDNGNSKTQDNWANYSESARKNGGFYTPDYPLFFATLERAYALKTNPSIEEVRQKIKELSRVRWLMALSRIKYDSNGDDEIVHNHGMSDQYSIKEHFMGQDGKIPAGSQESVYQKLLGTKCSVVEISNVFRWLNDTDTYIWRLNKTPKNTEGRVARFSVDSNGAYLCCYGNPSSSNASLGVRFIASPKGAS